MMRLFLLILLRVNNYCTSPLKGDKVGSAEQNAFYGSDHHPVIRGSSRVAADTPVYKITLSSATKFWKGDTVFYQINDVNNSGLVHALFDEQAADPLNGEMAPTPQTTFTSGYSTRVYYPAQVVLDLGGFYKITNAFIYNRYGTDSLFMLYGRPLQWSKDTLKQTSGGSGWKDFKDTIYTRYLKIFYANKGYQKTREIILYGHLVGKDSLARINPHRLKRVTPTQNTMGQFIGFNQIGPKEVDSVGALMRHYLQLDWMDTVTTTHDLDEIRFVFSKFGHYKNSTSTKANTTHYFFPGGPEDSEVKKGPGFSANDLHQMALAKTGYFDASQGIPVYAKKNNQGKPIDAFHHPDLDATKPESYDRLARMMWNYAAYYGSKSYPADSMQTPYSHLSGLGLRAFIENGNEMNQDWSGRAKHYTPQEYIAYSSAYYDGNLGKLGPRMGIKNADPEMIVVQAGTAGAHLNYLKGMKYYAYYSREDHSVPFDILNFHVYPTDGKNGRGTAPHAVSPETYFGKPDNPVEKYLKAATELFPGMPIWLTEWGYDRNRASKLSVPVIPGLDSAQIQAQWIARFWFLLSFTGVDRSTIFQLHNDPLPAPYDSAGTMTFNTTGLTDGHYLGDRYSPGKYAKSWYAFPAYYFQRTIWLKLYDYRPDSILYENKDAIRIYKYRNVHHPDSVAYAIWSGTQTNRSVSNYSIQTGHPRATVAVTTLADKHFLGITTSKKTDENGKIPLTISETPILLFAEDGTGGGRLERREE